jgi:uncharacterized protein
MDRGVRAAPIGRDGAGRGGVVIEAANPPRLSVGLGRSAVVPSRSRRPADRVFAAGQAENDFATSRLRDFVTESMVIGILQFELLIHGAESIKDKRRVVNSVKDRLHREHLVSIAEIGNPDAMSVAVLGLAVVSRDGKHAGDVLDRVTAKLRQLTDAELGEASRQVLYGSVIGEGEAVGSDAEEPTVSDDADRSAVPPRAGLHGMEHDLDEEMLRRAGVVESNGSRRWARRAHDADEKGRARGSDGTGDERT